MAVSAFSQKSRHGVTCVLCFSDLCRKEGCCVGKNPKAGILKAVFFAYIFAA
jgi:hypothetical protein